MASSAATDGAAGSTGPQPQAGQENPLASANGALELAPWECINAMIKGAPLCKFGRRGDPHYRNFALSPDGKYLTWYSHKKSAGSSRGAWAEWRWWLHGCSRVCFLSAHQRLPPHGRATNHSVPPSVSPRLCGCVVLPPVRVRVSRWIAVSGYRVQGSERIRHLGARTEVRHAFPTPVCGALCARCDVSSVWQVSYHPLRAC